MARKFLLNATAITALLVTVACGPASADTLLGGSVTGSINFGDNPLNYFDPANGGVPAGYLNALGQPQPVTMAEPAIEFGYKDGANEDAVNFFATGFTVTDNVFRDATNWTIKLTSDAFTGLILQELTDDFDNGGVIAVLLGDLITLTWAGTFGDTGLRTATYSLTAPAVPIPAALPLFAAGLGAMGFMGWRRKRRAA